MVIFGDIVFFFKPSAPKMPKNILVRLDMTDIPNIFPGLRFK